MSEKKEVITFDYGDKQYCIALRGIVERKEKNWKKYAKQLRESFEASKKAAEEGDPAGQFNLGMHYDYGFGVEESDEEAFKWYEKSAQQGHADGMHYTAWAYGQGRGAEKDRDKSLEWEKKATFAYYAESKTAAPKDTRDKIASAVHAVLCLADHPPDEEIITLFNEMRTDPQVQEYAAYRYSASPTFLDDLERQLKAESKT